MDQFFFPFGYLIGGSAPPRPRGLASSFLQHFATLQRGYASPHPRGRTSETLFFHLATLRPLQEWTNFFFHLATLWEVRRRLALAGRRRRSYNTSLPNKEVTRRPSFFIGLPYTGFTAAPLSRVGVGVPRSFGYLIRGPPTLHPRG